MHESPISAAPIEEFDPAARLGLRVEHVVETQAGRGGVVLRVVPIEGGTPRALKVSPTPDPADPLAKATRRREALIREAKVLRELGGPIGERYLQPDHAVLDQTGAIHLLDFVLTHRPGDLAVPLD